MVGGEGGGWPHSVGLLAIGEGFPHEHSEAPHVALAGEAVVVDALRGIPLHRPLPVGLGLRGAEAMG